MRRISICLLIALSFIWFGACQRCFAQQIIGRPIKTLSNDPCVTCVQNAAANTVHLTGGVNLASSSTAVTGLADSKTVTCSFWIKRTSSTGFIFIIDGGGGAAPNKIRINLNGSGTIQVLGRNSANVAILQIETNAAISSGAWHHILIVVDMADAAKRKIYVDGTSVAISATTYTNDTLDLSPTSPLRGMFNDPDALGQTLNADLAEFWIDDSYNDNVCYFYCSGKPTTLGSNGQLVNGALPAAYYSLSGSGSSWFTDSSGNSNSWSVSGTPSSPTPP